MTNNNISNQIRDIWSVHSIPTEMASPIGHDIGFLVLTESFDFSQGVDSAAMRDSAKWRLSSWFHNVFNRRDDILKQPGIYNNGPHNGEYETCMAVGWGLDRNLGFYRLRAAEVILFSKKVCATVLKKVSKYDIA